MSSSQRTHVVVAGGGPAAVEALLALANLAGDRVRTTLVAPDHDLELKPFRVATPFGAGGTHLYAIAELVHYAGAELVRDTLAAVRPGERRAVLGSGEELAYAALLVAVGARPRAPFPRAAVFGAKPHSPDLADVLTDLEGGRVRAVAFVVPPGPSWPLPVYELALLTGAELRAMGIDGAQLMLVTPEQTPLALFGPAASAAVARLLEEAGIAFRGAAYASMEAGELRLRPGGEALQGRRIVTVPVLDGPTIAGLPGDERGFLPIDEHARVRGVEDVYGAGDATDFPVKQGSMATQQADAAAYAIAASAGAPVEPEGFRPVLRGKLLTGDRARFMRAPAAGGAGEGRVSEAELWWPPAKLSGRWLGPLLAWIDAGRPPRVGRPPSAPTATTPGPPDGRGIDVEVDLDVGPTPSERRRALLSFDPYSPTVPV